VSDPKLPGNLYDVLEVSPRARKQVIKAAYKALIKEYHPDNDKGNTRITKALNQAKAVLLDEQRRKQYDRKYNKLEGVIIGDFRVLERIAEGGFGKTYKGEHLLLGTPVCIKHGLKISPQDEELLMEEARAIWDLRHFGIPAIRDIVKLEDGSLALIMSYIPGPTLEKIIKKNKKGLNEWLHPDLVGVYFPFKEYSMETIEIQKGLSVSSVKLFSFELKISLTFGSLRRDYFQTVSNSSWANEGYLVTLKIDDDSTLMDEIRRLNNAFGIGVIKLNAQNLYESEILFPAKEKAEIDWDTVNRLEKENVVFREFLKNLSEDIKLGKVKSSYDEFYTPEKLEKFIREKKIITK